MKLQYMHFQLFFLMFYFLKYFYGGQMAVDQMSCFLVLVGARVFTESAEDVIGG